MFYVAFKLTASARFSVAYVQTSAVDEQGEDVLADSGEVSPHFVQSPRDSFKFTRIAQIFQRCDELFYANVGSCRSHAEALEFLYKMLTLS
jgi:hypothetical protein